MPVAPPLRRACTTNELIFKVAAHLNPAVTLAMAVFRGFPSGRAPNASLASPQQIIDEEQAKGDSYFRQEWLCQFLETAIYALDELTINNLIKQYVAAYKWL